ncbi:cobalamin B12-binding domain-containing protein [Liberiplasma polymorphum]|uniref:cobalamin B12-binding domain-containing protein n=1 Tax=Liberiplasma polymorphum TaxID=3374570 RepID=UPI0037738F1B
MEKFIETLERYLKRNAKDKAHQFVDASIDSLEDLHYFYETVIPKILNNIDCAENDAACIWLEHQMSAIVRSLIETSYLKVIKMKFSQKNPKRVIIACTQDETHELGAVIGANLFEIYGFNTTYIGANTPLFTLKNALDVVNPDYLVLSVTNAYNLFTLNKLLSVLKKDYPNLTIIGSGRGTTTYQNKLMCDHYIKTSSDLKAFMKKEGITCSR